MRTRSEENQLGRSGITIKKKKKNEGEKEREEKYETNWRSWKIYGIPRHARETKYRFISPC